MVTVRSKLAKRNAGGPQFSFIPQRIVVEVDGTNRISKIADGDDELTGHLLDSQPVGDNLMSNVMLDLEDLGFEPKGLENTGLIVAETDDLTAVVDNIESRIDQFSDSAINEIQSLRSKAEKTNSTSLVDAFRPGLFNFNDPDKRNLEANLRNELLGDMTNPITDAVSELSNVARVEVSYSYNTPGPRNLGVNPLELDIADESDGTTLGDVVEKLELPEVWEETTGENAVVAIFDTSFSEKFVRSDRVIDTFSGQDVDNAYSKPEEGHGTMTAYSAAGNSGDTINNTGEPKVEYDGMAKDADILLARLSDSEGGLTYTEEAWDWLAGWIKTLDRPVISNHSYGIPLCSARGQGLCDSIGTNISAALSKRNDHQAFYAAGNEAQYCGHRLSGVTNGIAGVNSRPESITVGAFRFDLNGAQVYSSHGFGACSTFNIDPKPDIGSLIPSIVPYGDETKDMGSKGGGSNAGTSEACPIVAGLSALIASKTGTANSSVIEALLEGTAELPVSTQVNALSGFDARYGSGQVQITKAIDKASTFQQDIEPSATFSFTPSEPRVGQQVEFDASQSSDPNNDIQQYVWNFGGSEGKTGVKVSHTFQSPGDKTVELTTIDQFDNRSTFEATVEVIDTVSAEFNVSKRPAVTSEPVTFDASPSDTEDIDIAEYNWILGDGSTSTGKIVEHTYTSSGEYTVELQVVDVYGNTDVASLRVSAFEPATPRFSVSTDSANVGESITVDGSDTVDPDGEVQTYAWDFGDGTTSSGVTASHTYEDSGQFDITLTVTDTQGLTSSTTQTLRITAEPAADFEVTPESPRVGDTVTLDGGISSDPDGTIQSYTWDLGQGDEVTGQRVTTTYQSADAYQVSLGVEDSQGNADVKTKTVDVVSTGEPNADFVINPRNPDTSQLFTVDASPSTVPTGNITSYTWNIENQGQETGRQQQIEYTDPGSYDITLLVEDNNGNTDRLTRQISVSQAPGEAVQINPAFNVFPSDPSVGEEITMDASVSSISNSNIDQYQWNFGDGNTSQGEVVDKEYSRSGTYNVTLTVIGVDGNRDSTTQNVSVSEPSSPVAEFVIDPVNPTVGEDVELDASSSTDPDGDIQSYIWNLGDGETLNGETVTTAYDSAIQYQVILTVEDSRGNQDSELGEIRVTEAESSTDTDSSNTGETDGQTDEDTSSSTDEPTDSNDESDTDSSGTSTDGTTDSGTENDTDNSTDGSTDDSTDNSTDSDTTQ